MDKDWDAILLGAIVGACLGFMIGLFIGFKNGQTESQAEAVSAGKAEYYLDQNNNRQWRWK